MNISEEELSQLTEKNKDLIFDTVGYFPKCTVGKFSYPEAEICLKYGKQNPNNVHNGFGIAHLVKGDHINDVIYKDVNSFDDLAKVLKRMLSKHSKIFMENEGNFIIVTTKRARVVLNYIEKEQIYSVVTCHSVSNTYDDKRHGNMVAKIKKDLNTQ